MERISSSPPNTSGCGRIKHQHIHAKLFSTCGFANKIKPIRTMLLIDIFKKLFNKDTTRFPSRKLLIDEITRLNRKYDVKGFARLNLTCYDDTSWNNLLANRVLCMWDERQFAWKIVARCCSSKNF